MASCGESLHQDDVFVLGTVPRVLGAERGGPTPIHGPPYNPGVARGRFHLTFPPNLVDEPIVHKLGTDFGLMTNIRRANINERIAWLILELDGEDRSLEAALAWLAEQGVQVDRLEEESPS